MAGVQSHFVDNQIVGDEQGRLTMRPRMSSNELKLFEWTASGKKYAVEFGVGGSTFCLIESGVEKIFSIESDPSWVQKLVEHDQLMPHIASGRLTVHYGNIGPTRKWGHPLDGSRIEDWPNYWSRPWNLIEADEVDLVFVDGRFRVACTLNALLKGNPNITIAVHDFWDRSKYAVMLKYLNCACRADTLAVFFPKAEIDLSALKQDLRRYSRMSH